MPKKGKLKNGWKKITFIDLFAWIGWFHLALHNIWGDCVFSSEWDDKARMTYKKNFEKLSPTLFENWNFVGDITKVDEKKIPDFDILCGWFPCQPFSQAWHKKWFNETRWTLFFDIVRIIKEKKPKAFFIENVRWLLNHDNWRTFSVIKDTIENELWYSFHYKIVKASDFWLPQNRPRLFMVGFRDKDIDFKFPEPVPLNMTMSDVWWWKCSRDIWFTLRVGWRWSNINDRRNWDSYLVDDIVRRIGPIEWKKMQWLPDDFEFPVSNWEAMKQLWNSVAVPAIQAVAENIILAITKKYYAE